MPIDPANLEALIDRYWPALVEWVGGARDGAEDIVQTAFIKLAAAEPPPTNQAAWLFTVTKRLAINERVSWTKRRLREFRVGIPETHSTDNTSGIELRDLLNTLECREREIVIAKIWGGLTFDQIGSIFGDSKASVWRIYQLGISKLKDAYSE